MLETEPRANRGARLLFSLSACVCGVLAAGASAWAAGSRTTRAKLPEAGLLVHFACGTGSQTVRLAKGGRFVVHGLEKDAGKVARAASGQVERAVRAGLGRTLDLFAAALRRQHREPAHCPDNGRALAEGDHAGPVPGGRREDGVEDDPQAVAEGI